MLNLALDVAMSIITPITQTINDQLRDFTPTETIVYTFSAYALLNNAYSIYQNNNHLSTAQIQKKIKENAVKILLKTPVIGSILEEKIHQELLQISDDLAADAINKRRHWQAITTMPQNGLSIEAIRERFKHLHDDYHSGKHSGSVYVEWDEETKKLLKDIYGETAFTNPMHSTWELINLMQAEVLAMLHHELQSPLQANIEKLSSVKNELNDLINEAIASNETLSSEYNQLLVKQNLLRGELNNIPASEDGKLCLHDLETTKKHLQETIKRAVNQPLFKEKYHSLFNTRVELEFKTKNPGIITHGGSTSILEACKAHVLYAREQDIANPIIIIPETAHAAFHKAGKILHAKVITIPVNENNQVDLLQMEQALQKHRKNIAMIVGSAPSFPYGIIDPISHLGNLAMKYDVPLHVDSCLGGFLTVFAKDKIPPCDFSVPGVTSISIDTHKYGLTPKGSSLVLFRPGCKATPTYTQLDWPGGMYVTEGIDGSRSGADIANTWAMLCKNGVQFYQEQARKIIALRENIETELQKIPGLIIPFVTIKEAKLNIVGIKAEKNINLLLVQKYLKENHWDFPIMQTSDSDVDGLHFCLTSVHINQADFLDKFCAAIKNAFDYAQLNSLQEATSDAKVYGNLKSGIPLFVQRKIGEIYTGIRNTITNPTTDSKPLLKK